MTNSPRTRTPDRSDPARPDPEAAWEYARGYYQNQQVIDDFELLARYRPEVFQGYVTLRQAAFNTGPDAALSSKMKELVILAVEIAAKKTNPPPVGHTRRAIEAGASVAEIAEVVSLCIMLAGMLTYQESGRHVLRAAEELARERDAKADSSNGKTATKQRS